MLAQRYQKKCQNVTKTTKVHKKTTITIKSTDTSPDRQASSAPIIRLEKLSRDHQLS